MGGCATKLKGVKADAGDLPAPEPAPPAKEEAGVVSETKKEVVEVVEEEKKVVVQEGEVKEREGDKDREIHDDDKVDDQGSKRRSLSLLFKENEEGDDSNKEEDKAPSEVTKQEQESLIEKATEEYEKKLPEVEKSETAVEEALVSSTEQTFPEVEKSKIPVEEPPVSSTEQKLPEVEKSGTPVEEALDTYHCLGLAVAAADTSLAIASSSSLAGAVPTFIISASLELLECESVAMLFISAPFAHNMAYNPITISTPPIILPRCNFSSRSKESRMATNTSKRGLKTDTKRGPLLRTHQLTRTTINPDAKNPV